MGNLSANLSEGREILPGATTLSTYKVPRTPRAGRMQFVKQSTAAHIRILMLSSSSMDNVGVAGLASSLVVKICKPGDTTYGTITPTSITDLGNGNYNLLLTTTHTNTLGPNSLRITGPNVYPNDDIVFQVVAIDLEERLLGQLPIGTVVTDGSNSVTAFKTNLTQVTSSYWDRVAVSFIDGALADQVAFVTGFDGTTKFITVETPGFTGTPAGGTTFYLVNK